MPSVNAKCPKCGAHVQVDPTRVAAMCSQCGSAFYVDKAINCYKESSGVNPLQKSDAEKLPGSREIPEIRKNPTVSAASKAEESEKKVPVSAVSTNNIAQSNETQLAAPESRAHAPASETKGTDTASVHMQEMTVSDIKSTNDAPGKDAEMIATPASSEPKATDESFLDIVSKITAERETAVPDEKQRNEVVEKEEKLYDAAPEEKSALSFDTVAVQAEAANDTGEMEERYATAVVEEVKEAEKRDEPLKLQIENGVLVGFTGFSAEIKIPRSVRRIADKCFSEADIEAVELPDTVVEIGNNVFENCRKLKTVILPETLQRIGNSAFYGCVTLVNISIPASVSYIGDHAFYGCVKLENVSVPEKITALSDHVFYGCAGLVTVSLPKSLASIGNGVFSGCIRLDNLILPESLTKIGDYAFYGCAGIMNAIVIPKKVTEIGVCSFQGCMRIPDISIMGNVTRIGAYTFQGCAKLENFVMPKDMTTIGDGAFANCIALTSIVIPKTVTQIGRSAFDGCTQLNKVKISNKKTTQGSYAFRDCPLQKVSSKVPLKKGLFD